MFSLKLSVDAHIHNGVCEYTYLARLYNVLVKSSGVLVKYFYENEPFETGWWSLEKGF